MKTLKKQELKEILDNKHYVEFIIDSKLYRAKKTFSFKGDGRYLIFDVNGMISRNEYFSSATNMLPNDLICSEFKLNGNLL
jgi:hypothetical protein